MRSEITGLAAPREDIADLPNIFSSNLGLRRAVGWLRRLFEIMRLGRPGEDERRCTTWIAQWLVGRDPLICTMAQSLRHHLILQDGGPLCETRLRKVPT